MEHADHAVSAAQRALEWAAANLGVSVGLVIAIVAVAWYVLKLRERH